MSASPAQFAANRRNAQHSPGPVTEAGKSRSSRNAAGPIARFLVMSEEDQQNLQDLIDTYVTQFNPAGPIASDLITDMAVARWRRCRLLEFEASLLSHTMDKVRSELGPTATRVEVQAIALERLIDGSKTWNTLHRYIRDAERTFNACLKQINDMPTRDARPSPRNPIRKNEPTQLPAPLIAARPTPDRFGPNVPLRPNGYPVNLALAL